MCIYFKNNNNNITVVLYVIITHTLLFTSLFQYIYAPDNKRFMAEELS